MGERSRLIGEYGEKTVENFIKLIGWGDVPRNIEYKCIRSEHVRTTHGVDFYYTYLSPLVDGVLKRIFVSSKFSDKAYPNTPGSEFKKYYDDLANAIDCAKLSSEFSKYNILNGYQKVENIGLLFWLSNADDEDATILSKLDNLHLNVDYGFDSFYVVDNKKASFIYKSLTYLNLEFPSAKKSFFYPDTGKNINPITKTNHGSFLPIEYINTSILPFRIEHSDADKISLALFSNDNFKSEDLKRLIGLSKEISKSWSSNVYICFPDYNKLTHSADVRLAKSTFMDTKFTDNVSVVSYDINFKSLQQ